MAELKLVETAAVRSSDQTGLKELPGNSKDSFGHQEQLSSTAQTDAKQNQSITTISN